MTTPTTRNAFCSHQSGREKERYWKTECERDEKEHTVEFNRIKCFRYDISFIVKLSATYLPPAASYGRLMKRATLRFVSFLSTCNHPPMFASSLDRRHLAQKNRIACP
jgi:hypothetical protein